ncbi:hypothetical protein [Carboxylicivirga sediminis]|nr:hypothetical protein [Carboxylicivirga sediminis]
MVKIIKSKLLVYLRAMVQVDAARYGDFDWLVQEIIKSNNNTVK